jgi:hypothetical protein
VSTTTFRGQIGTTIFGQATLPAGVQRATLSECMEACAQVGDWTNVLAAFSHAKDLRPDNHFDDVMSSAIAVALRESVDATAPKWP